MKQKCWMVIHEEKFTKELHHKIFDSKELADKYAEELTIITDEAKWVEIRMFDVHTEDDVMMTPVQEDLYWDSHYSLYKEQQYGAEF